MRKEDFKIVFLGTPEFAVEPLGALLDAGYNISAVVTMPDKIAGRGHKLLQSDVKKFAVAHNLPVLQPANLKDPAFTAQLQEINADLFIVIAFRMLPEAVWKMPRFGTFNLHASLLPRYRGAAPINWAIINGEKETGVTTFFLKHEIDTGDIIEQESIAIGEDENIGSLYDRLMHLGTKMVLRTVEAIVKNDGNVPTKPQPAGEFTPAPKIFTETCKIDWNRPRKDVRNLIRGLSPYPCAFTFIANAEGEALKFKIFDAKVVDLPQVDSYAPGSIYTAKNMMAIKCADGWLELGDVQLQGKKRMPAGAFLLGFNVGNKIAEQ